MLLEETLEEVRQADAVETRQELELSRDQTRTLTTSNPNFHEIKPEVRRCQTRTLTGSFPSKPLCTVTDVPYQTSSDRT